MKKIIMLLVFVLVFAIIGSFLIVDKIDKINIKNASLYQYVGGNLVDYNGDVNITFNDNESIIYNNDIKVNSQSDPIYYKQENRIILPNDMAIFDYMNLSMKKVPHHSYVFLKDYSIILENDKNEKEAKRSFLYDGNKTYIFLDDMKLKVGNRVFLLDPLSYVSFLDSKTFQFYLKSENRFETMSVSDNESIKVINEDLNVEIDLISDSIIKNEQPQLLLKNLSNLPNFF